LALLVVLLAVAAGCGSDDSSDESTAESANTVDVTASDFKFDPSSLSVDAAGRTTFHLTNNGGTTHALEIEGNGIEEETDEIGPGESADVTVDLKDGQYEFYCPVDGHREQGMEGTLVVGSGAGGAGTTTEQGETDDDNGGTTTGETETDDDDPYGG
jgi:uncharacterized cupredoxin-like copper-binding protein